MSNNNYNKVNIPKNIDARIDKGVEKAVLEKAKTTKKIKRKVVGTVAASLVAVFTLGVSNPALAAKIPVIGNVFEAIEKNIWFPGNYSQYATSVNETAYSNGIGVTLSEILCDGQSLYATYIVESEEPFKDTTWGDELDVDQLDMLEAYNKVDFSDKKIVGDGFAGLEGKFINEKTFVGIEKYKLSSLKTEIPDKFEFKTKINMIGNFSTNREYSGYHKIGTWAFKIPVTVNKELRTVIDLNKKDIESEVAKVNSISLTPFEMILDVSYKVGTWYDYETLIYDENGKRLNSSGSDASNEENTEKIFMAAPSAESKSIRMVIKKLEADSPEKIKELEGAKGNGEIVLDKIIQLK